MKRLAYIVLFAAVAVPAVAQQPEEDLPGMGVARLSVMDRDVSLRRGDSGEVVAAAVNAPLVVTDRLLTGPGSRAELQFDSANMMRIGSNAEVRLGELDARRYQIQVALGTTTFRVLRQSNAEVEISTPCVSVRPLGLGVYRVTVREDGSSEITVRLGEADIFSPKGSERLSAGNTILARGSASDPEFQVVGAIPGDDWDRWNDERDRMMERSQSYRYVSPDINGAEDLDGHGRWVNDENYGAVWAPTVAPGWAPYQQGRWVWEDYYGWTWVSYDPWGWAPYHYGRWFNSPGFGWCWWPGGFHERHFWRPGLVAFFGFGGFHAGVGFGFGFGNIGWVPLGPHEAFHPWYGRGFYGGRSIGNSAIVGNSNIAGMYRNARFANGITAMRSDAFGRQGVNAGSMVRVDGRHLESAGLVRGVLPVTPGRESLRMSDRNAPGSGATRSVERSTFFSTRGNSASGARSVPFEQQRQAVDRVAQRNLSNSSSFSAAGRGAATGQTNPTGAGWRQAGGSPGTGSMRSAPGPRSEAVQQQGGWQRFGGTEPRVSGGGSGATPSYRTPPAYSGYRGVAPSSQPPVSGRSYGSYGSQSVRISPPIVRDRPSYSPGTSGGGSHYSAPAQHYSAPPSRPSGGGTSHGGGGGGGGAAPHASSGGGHHGR